MPLDDALISLEGLSVGDAFGEQFFWLRPEFLLTRTLPPGRWGWTDDTHMALSVVEILKAHGGIHQDSLAAAFARRFTQEPHRGYGRGAANLLRQLSRGDDWRAAAPALFGGGSYGNGAAMRAGPIGGFFKGDPERAAREAKLSAEVTHAHPEGQAGAMAVAAAAAIAGGAAAKVNGAAAMPGGETVAGGEAPPAGNEFLRAVLPFVPEGATREGIGRSFEISRADHARAVEELGTGSQVSSQDTVPYCLWCAAHHMGSFEEAMWWTVMGLGDSDTTCAIVGGIVSLVSPVPAKWIEHREPLPVEFRRLS